MAIVWPATLPQLPDLGLKEKGAKGALRTEMDVGPAKMRRRTTSTVKPFEGTVSPLTAAQKDTLMSFYHDTVKQVLPFEWTVPSSGATVNMRFVEPPEIEAIHPSSYRAAFKLEILP